MSATAAAANGVTGSNTLTTVIEPFSSNTTATVEPEFTFHATSSLNFTPDAVLYQVDTWQGPWLNATFQEGNEWAVTTPQLTPGFHILYAYATTGEEATSTDAGYQTSPVIGAMSYYGFLVAPPLGVLTPGSGLDFGTAEYGSEVGPKTFTLSNEGVGPLVFSDTVVFGGPNSGDFPETAGDTCVQYMSGLAAGTSCTLELDFMPSGFGTENATATVSTSNSGGIPSTLQPIPLTGISYPYLEPQRKRQRYRHGDRHGEWYFLPGGPRMWLRFPGWHPDQFDRQPRAPATCWMDSAARARLRQPLAVSQ